MDSPWNVVVIGVCCSALMGCAGSRPVAADEYASSASNDTGPDISSGFLGSGGLSGRPNAANSRGTGQPTGVNMFAWRGVLDTLSFMPLRSADPFGGVVETDWYQPPSHPNERFRVDAYVHPNSLQSNSIRLAVHREVRQAGVWVDEPASETTRRQLEDKSLARALALSQQVGNGH
jgi:Domain of unknown function (DUF3576)